MEDKTLDGYLKILQTEFMFEDKDITNIFNLPPKKLKKLGKSSKEYTSAFEQGALLVEPFKNNISTDDRLENLIDRLYSLEKISFKTMAALCFLDANQLEAFVNGKRSILTDREKYMCFGTLTTLYNIIQNVKDLNTYD